MKQSTDHLDADHNGCAHTDPLLVVPTKTKVGLINEEVSFYFKIQNLKDDVVGPSDGLLLVFCIRNLIEGLLFFFFLFSFYTVTTFSIGSPWLIILHFMDCVVL